MTSTRPALATRRTTRLLALWLLAFVLPLQGAALGVFAAKGPAHAHRVAAASAPLVLEDVRRWKPAPAAAAQVLASLGHVHVGDAAQRHLHAHGDASVVVLHGDEPDTDDAVGASSLSVLALIPSFGTAGVREPAAPAIPRRGWSLRIGFIDPFERPPKQG
ncbi:MAG: hypothetical protein H7Y61_12330 [Rhizobiales bacterium]|nr:hypothetical protein [Rhizobacter sp.]